MYFYFGAGQANKTCLWVNSGPQTTSLQALQKLMVWEGEGGINP